MNFRRSVLCIGGLDPSGGAGLSVDAAAVRSLELHPALVCALNTVQNGERFFSARPCPAKDVAAAMNAILSVQRVAAFKTGALGRAGIVRAVARTVKANPEIPLVVDPVLKSSSSGSLADKDAIDVMMAELFPLATLVTPNLDEAERITGIAVRTPAEMLKAAHIILARGPRAVLIKGGHLPGDRLVDMLVLKGGHVRHFEADRHDVGDVRGTGCALAALAAAHIGLGCGVEDAVQEATDSLRGWIAAAVHVGKGPRVLSF